MRKLAVLATGARSVEDARPGAVIRLLNGPKLGKLNLIRARRPRANAGAARNDFPRRAHSGRRDGKNADCRRASNNRAAINARTRDYLQSVYDDFLSMLGYPGK